MMATSNPFRSTIFRLALMAVAAFGLIAASVVFTVGRNANQILTMTTEEAIHADAAHFRNEHVNGGVDALAHAVDERSRHAAGGLYYLSDANGQKRSGNLAALPREIRGGTRAGIFEYRAAGSRQSAPSTAAGLLIDLDSGKNVLVVARDISSQKTLLASINRSVELGLGALALFGLGGGYLLARHLLRRIDAMSRVSHAIMAGNLAGRLPLAGSGDELDRLAAQLNIMLERIERLMAGLREVSDNIAHDLKTPLNRLRNSAEAALADTRGANAWRDGLERTIEEADDLIKTFNALLLIARLEAGAVEESLEVFDLADVAHDVTDLYLPVAEDRGLSLELHADTSIAIRANRHLIGQAVANLVDNAIKYSTVTRQLTSAPHASGATTISVVVRRAEDRAILTVADHGPGIPAADRDRVLKRFVRLEASRTRPGTGLGLSLVAAVAQMHDGAIRLEDNEPGLRVLLILPLAKETSVGMNGKPTAPARTEKV